MFLMADSRYSRSPLHGRHSRRSRRRAQRIGLGIAAALVLAAIAAAAILVIPRLMRQAPSAPDSSAAASEPSEPISSEAPDADAWTPEDARWMLRLVNPWNRMPDGYVPELVTLTNGQQVDARCYPALQQMMDDCRAAGLKPVICSSYRPWETQVRLFNTDVEKYKQQGMTQEQAEAETAKSVAVPGTSEHQLGLAVDIVDQSYQLLHETQQDTPAQQWLMANCWRYGFILRFPKDKESVTGITYEPWHYRYVGEEAAKAITEGGLCLEEYLQQ